MLGWYEAIVAAVTDITAGQAPGEAGTQAFEGFASRSTGISSVTRRRPSFAAAAAGGAGTLAPADVVANAGALLFGGIETTDGMIANAVLHLLSSPRT